MPSSLRCDGSSHGRVDGPPAARSVSLEHGTTVSAPGSGPDLRPRVCGAGESDGYSAGPVSPTVSLAAGLRRTGDRVDSPRMSGPCPRFQRRLTPSHADRVLHLLSSLENPS